MRAVGALPCIAIHELCVGIKFRTHVHKAIIRGHFINGIAIFKALELTCFMTGPVVSNSNTFRNQSL